MSLSLSDRCLQIAPSVTLAIDAKAKALKAQGVDVIGFGAGEPDFNTPEYIRDAAKCALDEGITKYTPVAGTLALREQIVEKLKKDNNLTYDVSEIIDFLLLNKPAIVNVEAVKDQTIQRVTKRFPRLTIYWPQPNNYFC